MENATDYMHILYVHLKRERALQRLKLTTFIRNTLRLGTSLLSAHSSLCVLLDTVRYIIRIDNSQVDLPIVYSFGTIHFKFTL